MVTKYVIIVAGGSGKRMNSSLPKQFIEIEGIPILMHTFFAFQKFSNDLEYILVLPQDQMRYWLDLCLDKKFDIPHKLVAGGKERFHSVSNALEWVEKKSLVAIHDGVRPLVSIKTIENCFETALRIGNAVPVIDVNESLRKLEENSSVALDRKLYKIVQTPQIFDSTILKEAYKAKYTDYFTDDASVLEYAGHNINLVHGNTENIKITSPLDLIIAAYYLKGSIAS